MTEFEHACPNCGDNECLDDHDEIKLACIMAYAMHEFFIAQMLGDLRMMLWTQTWAETKPKNRHKFERN